MLLAGGNDQFLFVDAFADIDTGYLLAKIGNGIDGLLNGTEVAASILSHYIIA